MGVGVGVLIGVCVGVGVLVGVCVGADVPVGASVGVLVDDSPGSNRSRENCAAYIITTTATILPKSISSIAPIIFNLDIINVCFWLSRASKQLRMTSIAHQECPTECPMLE